ncbi:aldo/keto reductase [Luteimonas sp. Y-2-2-4F]|nr:aldo/keto reductase [Luteimonas sp. Y-2-2-4F]MCD9033302.1 aldo/keto reductase [Luteimonas sp. Y-2-2-4F]
MQYTRLGRTGLPVSRLALGTMTFGLQTDEAEAQRILDRALDAGVTLVDTADMYPIGGTLETVGRTEEIVGRWLRRRRGEVVVATKGVSRVGPAAWNAGGSRKHLIEAAEASLRRLGTDAIDLYQLHADDPETPLDETLEALDHLVRTGKARYVGVSNFLAYRLARALGRADVLRTARPVSVQPRYNLLFRQIERELLPLAAEEGLGVLAYNPLAGGLLTGKHRPGAPPAGTRFTLGTVGGRYQDRYWHPREFEAVEALEGLAAAHGLPLATLAIAWALANPVVGSVLLGASRAEQLDQTLAAADLALDAGLKQELDALTHGFRFGDATR